MVRCLGSPWLGKEARRPLAHLWMRWDALGCATMLDCAGVLTGSRPVHTLPCRMDGGAQKGPPSRGIRLRARRRLVHDFDFH